MSDRAPASGQRRALGTLGDVIRQRPWLLSIGLLGIWLFRYGMLGYVAAGVVFFSTFLLGALALADRATRDETEASRRLRARNVAIALALGAMVVMFFVATLVRLGANVGNRPM